MDAQLKRGVLEAAVLSVLNQGDSYGYAIIREIGPVLEVSESTLYPILRRLETQDMVTEQPREYNGRLRKYYSITNTGRQRLIDFMEEWKEMVAVIEFITDSNRGKGK
ncbi:MAG: PadR family transcriptional regulator [Erysipelotrichia bacterium]|nr:PadR family transcriptional regulator [Erysipelotrichia bacterium]